MSIGDFTVYFAAITGVGEWLTKLANSISSYVEVQNNVTDFRSFLELSDDVDKKKIEKKSNVFKQIESPITFTFEHVSFSYEVQSDDGVRKIPVIRNLNLVIEGGEKIALVGVNGTGKSTFIKLLCGIQKPEEGRILVNGIDSQSIAPELYFSLFAAVFQKSQLLPVSIADNIMSGTKRNSEHMWECVRMAGLEEKINALFQRVDTCVVKQISEEGVDLSGGQQQRLFLARALYKNAPVLILDEPTAALDPIAENDIYQKYNEFTKGKTSVFVSHRLSSTRFCDRILLMEKGEIVEDAGLIKRGLLEFQKILLGQLNHVFFRGVLNAGIPYIAVLLSANIINELTTKPRLDRLLLFSIVTVLTVFLMTIIKNVEEVKAAVGASKLFQAHEIYLTQKAYRVSYELLEEAKTRQLRDQVSGSINVSGAGMASLYWDMDTLVTNLLSAGIAIGLCIDFLKKLVQWDYDRTGMFVQSMTIGFILCVLTVVGDFVSCKTMSKRFDASYEVFEQGAGYKRYGEFYTMNYLTEENSAMDVRIYNQEALILRESQEKCYDFFARGKQKEMRAVSKYDGIRLTCICLCGMVVYLMIGRQAMLGAIGCGSIVVMYAATTKLIGALSDVAEVITDLRNNNIHLIHFFEYIDLPEDFTGEKPGEAEQQEEKIMEPCKTIVFENVSFRYPQSKEWVLKDINIIVQQGEKLALVGENGSGKTTLIKLLCRLYRPTTGRILLDGKDIWSYSYDVYIRYLSTVFQDVVLFAFSIAENVAASREYDENQVMPALKKAGLEKKVEGLQMGCKQTLFHDFEEGGTDLSGGEAQKVTIARAVYKNGEIMILDEPTAALDPYAEYEIYKNFGDISAEKTVFSISHRLSSCRFCDRIVVIVNGSVVQSGTHEELLAQPEGKYFVMWNAQAQYYQ